MGIGLWLTLAAPIVRWLLERLGIFSYENVRQLSQRLLFNALLLFYSFEHSGVQETESFDCNACAHSLSKRKLGTKRSCSGTRLIICFHFVCLEIGRVRANLFQISGHEKKPMILPDAVGSTVNLSEKVYVPVKEFPDVSLFA